MGLVAETQTKGRKINSTIKHIPKRVRILVNLGGGSDLHDSALTRKKEIETNYPKDKLIYITDNNLGNLGSKISTEIEKAKKEGFEKTCEFSVFGHSASDGPRGGYHESNPLDLSKETGDSFDKGQMSRKGWRELKLNLDRDANIAAFYGCNTLIWAEKFMSLQPDVLHCGGLMGKAGGTYSKKKFDQTWLNVFNSDVYMRTVVSDDDSTLLPVYYYTRGVYDTIGKDKFLKEHETWDNLTI